MTWDEVVKDPSFSELSNSDQSAIRAQWVDKVYVPKLVEAGLKKEDIDGARYEAISQFDNGQGYVSSFVNSAGRGVATTGTAAVQGAGALLGSQGLEDLGTGAEQSVTDALNVNPSLENTNFAGNVVGNVAAMAATGGAGGFAGKALGAARLGAEIGTLGTGFLAGAGQGAQEADKYGITGDSRYLRALAGGVAEVASEKIPFGMGTELGFISKIPGLKSVSPDKAGSFLHSVLSEGGEEVASQIAGNLSTIALAPQGVQTPGVLDDTLSSGLGGALGGGIFGGVNLLATPSERVAVQSQTAALQADDPEAAAVIAEANATRTPRLTPVISPVPTLEAMREVSDSTLNEEMTPSALEPDMPLPEFAEQNPVAPPLTEDLTVPAITDSPENTNLLTEAPVVPEPAVAEPEIPRHTLLSQTAEQVFPDAQLEPEQEDALAQENQLIDQHGRISETEAVKMFQALKDLGVTGAELVVNDTGNVPVEGARKARGSRTSLGGVDTIFLNRNFMRADTPLHEVVHGLVPEMRTSNPDLYQQGAAIIADSPLARAIQNRYSRDGIKLEGDTLIGEVMATLVGNDGAEQLRRYAGNSAFLKTIKEWLAKARVWLEDFMASKGVDPNMTLEQFAKKVNRRILAGQLRENSISNTSTAESVSDTNTAPTPAEETQAALENDQSPPAEPAPDTLEAQPLQPSKTSFGDAILAELPERARAAWSPDDLQAAEEFAAGDKSALDRLNPVQRARAQRTLSNLTANDDQSFSLKTPAQRPIQSGVAANQPGSPTWEMVQGITYRNESAAQALEEASRIYQQGQSQGFTFAQHLARLNAMTAQPGSTFNMTPGAYFGLMGEGLTATINDTSLPVVERDAAETNLKDLMAVWTSAAAQGGQFIKGFDTGLRIMNNAVIQARQLNTLAPFDGSQKRYDFFVREAGAATAVLDGLAVDAIREAPEKRIVSTVEEGVGKIVRGEDAADAGIITVEDALSPAIAQTEADASVTESDWFQAGLAQLSAEEQAAVDDWLVYLEALSLSTDSTTEFSLTSQERSARARELAATLSRAELVKGEAEARRRVLSGRKTLVNSPQGPRDIKALVTARLNRNIDRLLNPGTKKSKGTAERIAATISNAILAKAGYDATIKADPDAMIAAMGVLLSNQQLAMESVQDIHAQLQNDPATNNTISQEKLRGFMQLLTGRQFAPVNGESVPYGERQIAAILKSELARLGTTLTKTVKDAALRGQTAQQLEEQLRSPERGFASTLDAATLDKVVNAVLGEYTRSAAERARANEANKGMRAAMKERRDARKAALAQGQPIAPQTDDVMGAVSKNKGRVIDYLAREYGFDLSELVRTAREADRAAGVEALTLKLADSLGLSKEQTQEFMRPVIAEAMKTIDARRKAQAERDVTAAIKRIDNRVPKKKKAQPTEAQRLIRLLELGAITSESVEKVMLNSMDAKQFTPEFTAWLEEMISKSNDRELPQTARDQYTASILAAIRSARGASVIGLLGEWTMSNIFFGASTFKVNAFWGAIKAVADSAVYAGTAGPAAIRDGKKISLPGASRALLKQALRGYSSDLQYQAKYIFQTGKSKLESDYTTQFSNSEFELLATFPDTEIKKWIDGKPLSPFWAKKVKILAGMNKYVRRTMVATDLVNRNQAYEMLKAAAVMRVIVDQGKDIPNNAAAWTKAIDNALYGGSFEDAKRNAFKQVDDEIAEGKVQPQERGIRFGEILDSKLGQSLGIPATERAVILANAVEEAKRWTVANQTEGVLGAISNKMLDAVRDIPGLKFLLPAVRMPIGAFSQGLDWSPIGFLRAQAIKWNHGKSSSVTNAIFNPNGAKKSWNLPANGVTSERAVELRTKAAIGTSIALGLFAAAMADFDKDEDDADFYITGKGPDDPAKNKLWREKGNRPFSLRIKPLGVHLNYQESPIYASLATIGAWSDAHRYGKPEDTTSDRLAYAITRSMAGFGDAAVLKNLNDALGTVTGGSGYSASDAGKWTSRVAGVLIAPRIGSEINTILFGPQDQKQLGWAGRALANVPFVSGLFNKPALNFFGEEIHGQRGEAIGEVLPVLAHRISPILTDDQQMQFVAKMGANPLSTGRRFRDGTQVMDDYDTVRKWAAASGKAIRAWLTPAKMVEFEKLRAADSKEAEKKFDAEILRIRTEELRRIPNVQF